MGRKRFSILKAALKTLQPVGTSTTSGTPPAGTVMEMFYNRGTRIITYGANANRNRVLNPVNVNPFGVPFTAENKYRVPMSSRVIIADRFVETTVVSHAAAPTGGAIVNKLFIPAKAILFDPDTAQASTQKTSKITGRKYNPKEGHSFTVPFGKATTTETFKERKQLIASSATTKVAGCVVSFQPENGRYL
ncbi:MAG: hypothetical protein WBB28_24940 [Crinalium sp.]